LQSTQPIEVRPLSDGRVVLLDLIGHRLVMVDRDLRSTTPILDETNPQPVVFPSGVGHLVAAPADTTYVLDVAAQAYRVVGPSGKVIRREAADPRYLRPFSSTTTNAVLLRGDIVYLDQTPQGPPVRGLQPRPDSFIVARLSIAHGRRDSLGVVKSNGAPPRQVVRDGKTVVIVPVPLVDAGDAWAVTSDGAIAMIRASDFHVDWIYPDGRRASTPPVRWPWHRYTRTELDSLRSSARAMQTRAAVRPAESASGRPLPFEVETEVSPDSPAVEPAFVGFSAMGDSQGRVWVRLGPRPRGPVLAPSVYGIIDRSGDIVDRVQFPPLRTVAGFGPNGLVYVLAGSPQDVTLERYRYTKP
jgi:hypothetical protein